MSKTKQTQQNSSTVYDVKSHNVTVEFTRNLKEAEEAYAKSSAPARNKAIYAMTDSGQKRRIQ